MLFALPEILAGATSANAATTIRTRAFLSVNPNPVQIGKDLVVSFWIEPIPPTAADIFHGFKVTITKPDGGTEEKRTLHNVAIGFTILCLCTNHNRHLPVQVYISR